jgi:hypothetical protein
MKAKWALYCDESDNSGKNFGDPAQPIFIEAGWYFCYEEAPGIAATLDQLERDEGYDKKEIKGVKLLKSTKGPRLSTISFRNDRTKRDSIFLLGRETLCNLREDRRIAL